MRGWARKAAAGAAVACGADITPEVAWLGGYLQSGCHYDILL